MRHETKKAFIVAAVDLVAVLFPSKIPYNEIRDNAKAGKEIRKPLHNNHRCYLIFFFNLLSFLFTTFCVLRYESLGYSIHKSETADVLVTF